MAVAFTENEKNIIRMKLYEASEQCLKNYGIRRTTVDELVKMVGISKGAFYIFYKSKEILFFEVLENFQKKIGEEMIETIGKENSHSKEKFISAIFELYIKVKDSFLMTIIQNNEMEYLTRKLPVELLEHHHSFDDTLTVGLFKTLGIKEDKNVEIVSAALRAIFMTMLHEKEIGNKFAEALKLLITGLANVIFQVHKN